MCQNSCLPWAGRCLTAWVPCLHCTIFLESLRQRYWANALSCVRVLMSQWNWPYKRKFPDIFIWKVAQDVLMVAHIGVYRNWRKARKACWGQSSYTEQQIGRQEGDAQKQSLQFFTNRPLHWEWPAWLLSHPFEGDFDIAPKLRGFFSNFDSYRVAASYIDEIGAAILSKALERGAHIELVMPWTPNVYADCNARKGVFWTCGMGTTSWKWKASEDGWDSPFYAKQNCQRSSFFWPPIRTLGNLLAKWGDSSNLVLKLHSGLALQIWVHDRVLWRGKFLWEDCWFKKQAKGNWNARTTQLQVPILSRFQLFALILADNFTSRCKAIEEARYILQSYFCTTHRLEMSWDLSAQHSCLFGIAS